MADTSERILLEHISRTVDNTIAEPAAIAFSGGVDSALMAQVCGQKGMALLTIGFENSHDIVYAKEISDTFEMPHYTHIITDTELESLYDDIRFGFESISWQENCIAFYFIAHLARANDIDTVVTANGIDELFCGYDLYRRMYSSGEQAILDMIQEKTISEIAMIQNIRHTIRDTGVQFVQPLLQSRFIDYAGTIPLHEKIRGKDDSIRKHIVRRAAEISGLPHDICWKRKKAMQYGSGIHRSLRRIRNAHSRRRSVL